MRRFSLFFVVLLVAFSGFAQEGEATTTAPVKLGADHYYSIGNFKKCIDICYSDLDKDYRNMDAYSYLCWGYLGLNDYKSALDNAKKALSIKPNEPRMLEVAGEACYFMGNYLESLSFFERYVSAVNIDIYNIRYYRIRYNVVYYFMGEIFLQFKEYNNAITAFSTAIWDNNGSYKGQTDKWKDRLSFAKQMAEFKE